LKSIYIFCNKHFTLILDIATYILLQMLDLAYKEKGGLGKLS